MQKQPPQSTELEKYVLGALMIEGQSYDRVHDLLGRDVFYDPKHQRIFEAIEQLSQKAKPIDLLSITNQLRSMGALDEVGVAYISDLTNQVGSTANLEYHSQLLQEYHIKRRLIVAGDNMIKAGYDDTKDVFDTLTNAEHEIYQLSNPIIGTPAKRADEALADVINEMEAAQNRELIGVPSLNKRFDEITNGYRDGDLNILAARPGQGKTAKAVQEATYQSLKGYGVAYFTLEMKRSLLMKRIFSILGNINTMKTNSGNLAKDDWQAINEVSQQIEGAKLFIDDQSSLNYLTLKSKLRKLKQAGELDIAYVDYLQLMEPMKKHGTREGEISEISRGLKNCATELDIPIVALSQLNRQVDNREKPVPKLSDLRESGSLEQDASLVTFLYWPKSYGRADEGEERINYQLITKNRHGLIESVPTYFREEFNQFLDVDEPGDEAPQNSNTPF